ncbi:hypothetical protein ACT3SZ_15185 [Corynebacterium sp. AOP40-9SA-29]|uniref:hypothetical protein n=1 Tax=Corynebacterium sp. AOP40-9SA-29 TaxID=3457677 RepID=UPI004034E149
MTTTNTVQNDPAEEHGEATQAPSTSSRLSFAVTQICCGISLIFLASTIVSLRSIMRVRGYQEMARDRLDAGTFSSYDAVPHVAFSFADYATIAGAGLLVFAGLALAVVAIVRFVKSKKQAEHLAQ